jgi:predicted metal-binding membrane protein
VARRRAAPAEAVVLGLTGAAWLSLIAWGASPAARYLNHEQLGRGADWMVAGALAGGWLLMIVAMMLPTVTPLVRLFTRVVVAKPDRGQLLGLLMLGYVVVWFGFGLLAEFNDWNLHRLVDAHPWLTAHHWVIAATVFAGAGWYQFSSLKYRCLDRCRLPMGFIQRRWSGGNEARQALRIGIDHGISCVGCCWTLMLVMFSLGMGSIGWMLALAAVMAAEKNLTWGRRLSAPVGVTLISVAAVMAAAQL